MMLSRLIQRSSNLRLATLVSSKSNSQIISSFIRPLSTNSSGGGGGGGGGGNGSGNDTPWSFSGVNDGKSDPFSSNDSWGCGDGKWAAKEEPKRWNMKEEGGDEKGVFGGSEGGEVANGGFGDVKSSGWDVSSKPWDLKDEDKVVFDTSGEMMPVGFDNSSLVNEEEERAKKEVFEKEEKELTEVIKGPDRAFGDLIAKSGITDEMLDSLIALKDFQGVQGLPPLTEIENLRREKSSKKSSRAEIELQMQEEIAKSRVRQVDETGRAYGTGRRKCSIARVWIVPGKGKFLVNDKEFDVYFPMLDHRAALLRPLAETKTLGSWDINCTVNGGGTTGQVGAIQLGISRALQNWEPDMRTALRAAGFLTRDSRVVERKKPGKAKARKSFQWVKR
ncbi:Ribosomal protein S5 domain 2-like superfamily protein [Raphanus sativus]|uniref:30S ribosomal protein S9, mitochondrial n=1 Tax=Raphanus sativus TaxID=3726 RepID=A0A6J0JFK9_RAPSA|nr:30S ribosomal protein S9, mitochondrial [Raphanus sativus]KAJ4890318.1 Ribosomal protein S5 domain 2-like superfamily protein [Raphanus sativus]